MSLDVKQEVNDVGENEPPPINSPPFRKREAKTSVVLLNNQTPVLGGLIQNKRARIRTGIPFLNRIPVLGYPFDSTEEKIEKTELLMLITPRVVGTPSTRRVSRSRCAGARPRSSSPSSWLPRSCRRPPSHRSRRPHRARSVSDRPQGRLVLRKS